MSLQVLPAPGSSAPSAVRHFEKSARGRRALGHFQSLLRYAAYPLLLVAAAVIATLAIALHWTLPLVNFTFVIGAFCYLALLERLIPYDRSWHPEAWEWRRDGLYYLITFVTGGVARAAVLSIGMLIAPLQTSIPLWAEIPAAIAIISLCSFSFHRLGHHHPWLWKVHGIHHVPEKVNVSNNNVVQFIDVFGNLFLTQLPLLLLGFSQPAVFAAIIFKSAQGYGVHANIDVKLGWLSYVLVTPEQHRLHHSADTREAGHYAADLTIWDLLFGSFTWSPGKAPARVGVEDPACFPPARSILASQKHPFRRRIGGKEFARR